MKLFCYLILFILSFDAFSKSKVKVLAIEYPPFLSSSESKNFGTNFTLLKEYAANNFKVEFEPWIVPPARAQLILENGGWCLSFYPPKETDPKARFIALSDQYVHLGLLKVAEEGEFTYNSLSALQGSVAIIRSNALGPLHKLIEGAGLELVHLETVEQGIKMLLAGRVDYAFGDNTTINTYTEIEGIHTLQFSSIPSLETQIGFFYNTGCEEELFKKSPPVHE